MQERGDGALFIDACPGSEIERIDAAKMAIRRFLNQPLDGVYRLRISRLAQGGEQCLCFVHAKSLRQNCTCRYRRT